VPAKTKNATPPARLAYSVAELAASFGVSRWTIDRIIRSGELETTKVGSLTIITREEVERYLARHATRATGKARPGDHAEDVAG
jgi:excisionase family DNA binding protein